MADYVLELKRKNDSIRRGRSGAGEGISTVKVPTPTTPPKDHVATWSFFTSDSDAVTVDALDNILASLSALAYRS